MRALGGFVLALLTAGAVYAAAVLLQPPEESPAADTAPAPTVTRMQSAHMEDAAALARLFEAPLPALPGFACQGEAGNSRWDGAAARFAVLTYEGFSVSAVQPAAAAPLLLRAGLEVSAESGLTVLGLPAMLCAKDGQKCLYFANEAAAYALYAPNAETEEFLSLAERLAWTE